jgi:hypothetical protein
MVLPDPSVPGRLSYSSAASRAWEQAICLLRQALDPDVEMDMERLTIELHLSTGYLIASYLSDQVQGAQKFFCTQCRFGAAG